MRLGKNELKILLVLSDFPDITRDILRQKTQMLSRSQGIMVRQAIVKLTEKGLIEGNSITELGLSELEKRGKDKLMAQLLPPPEPKTRKQTMLEIFRLKEIQRLEAMKKDIESRLESLYLG